MLHSILETIGNTPVIPLDRVTPENCAQIFAKYEAGNPSLSIKDRIALNLIEAAEKQGQINKNTTIVIGTAGNTGVALALVCVVKKYKLILFMPEDASLERRKMFEGFGTQLHVTPKEEGVPGAKKRAQEYADNNVDSFYLDQFDNPANVEAHTQTTAQEVLADFPDGLDAFVTGVGTGGTIMGVGSVLKQKFPGIKIVAVEPQSSAVLSGQPAGKHRIQQLGPGFIPGNVDKNLFDEVITVSDTDAYTMTRRLSRRTGTLVGISSGANVHAAIQVAQDLGPGKKVLTFLCDAGQRYFSIEQFFKN